MRGGLTGTGGSLESALPVTEERELGSGMGLELGLGTGNEKLSRIIEASVYEA